MSTKFMCRSPRNWYWNRREWLMSWEMKRPGIMWAEQQVCCFILG
jgi:hypothetical protein